MATLAESLVSSSSRKLPIRVRPDLKARRQRYQGRQYWVVKDPVALQYFRFEEEEFAIMQMLDGESSLEEIAERFAAEFPPQTIRTEELQQFIGMLHRSGLVLTDAAGQGVQLRKRRDEKKFKERVALLGNILSIRFKGFDPDRVLNFLLPYTWWFFTRPALIFFSIVGTAALTLLLVQFDVFHSRLPSFQTFFSAQNWLLLGGTLAITKVIHEFGHGLSCKRFGGECHEMGVMLLVLTPCLYCNVSDSWMLPNRWHRAAIGAAGMYVELVLASICTFIWWFTEPGLLNYICLNVMFVSSVSTILFNANPLLRYDGYYILSDILEIPNLRQKASSILNRKLGKWFLGLEEPEDPFLPKRHQGLFAFYTVAAAIYRWVVVFSILFFLNKVFEPYGLKILGQLIALGAIYGLLIAPLVKVFKFFRVPGRLSKVKRLRMYTTIGLLGAAVAAVLLIPLPATVICSLEVQPRDADSVYVKVPGTLEWSIASGAKVQPNDELARLENIDIQLSIRKLEGQIAVYQEQVAGLRVVSLSDDRAAARMAEIEEEIAAAQGQLAEQRRDAERLTIVAPRAGTVIPPTLTEDRTSSEQELKTWSGTPLDRENIGAVLEKGTKLCQIGDPTDLEARLAIDQANVELVHEGQDVEVMLNQSAEYVYLSHIEKKSDEAMKASPQRLSSQSGGDIPTMADGSEAPRPLTPHFDALVPLPRDDGRGILRVGLVGRAKIHIAPRTIGERLWTYILRTFNFEL